MKRYKVLPETTYNQLLEGTNKLGEEDLEEKIFEILNNSSKLTSDLKLALLRFISSELRTKQDIRKNTPLFIKHEKVVEISENDNKDTYVHDPKQAIENLKQLVNKQKKSRFDPEFVPDSPERFSTPPGTPTIVKPKKKDVKRKIPVEKSKFLNFDTGRITRSRAWELLQKATLGNSTD